ncbi:hypothetical protein PRIPAC_81431 [Pristionchus pacificus]|uniref:Uncharacterized protein n=1 Tax=Pristionchus pacificus TaxID=54126 RepID=A0A2A6BI11_PRIPA|nr:hypothetical protein PRIPAC_81431 [Pristionchus pacificus]|eukprot:PDM65555.1 hypothetical protein PRIPAC_52497 [Pristionchus pacificus]
MKIVFDQPVYVSEDLFGSLVNYNYLDLGNIVVEAESLMKLIKYATNQKIVGSHLIRYARDNEVVKFNIHMEKGENDNFTTVSIDKCLPIQIIRRV